jgi:hypothetical protein
MVVNLKTFAKDLTYQADTSVRQIFKDLKELAEIKQLAEQKAAYFSTWGWLGVGLILVSIFVWFFVVNIFGSDGTRFGFIMLVIPIVIATIFCWVKLSYYNKLKLREERCELPKKILSMVNRDRTPKSNVKIRIHFTPAGKMGKKIQTLPHPSKRGWKLDIFEDQWLTIEGKFLDSTNFFLTVTELNRRAYGWNTVNNKSKWKSKDKYKGTEINLRLTFPSKKYGATSFLQQAAPEAVKLPEEVNLKRMKVTPKAIDLTVNTSHFFKQEEMYQTITMMFLSLYQILNFAKWLSRMRQKLS